MFRAWFGPFILVAMLLPAAGRAEIYHLEFAREARVAKSHVCIAAMHRWNRLDKSDTRGTLLCNVFASAKSRRGGSAPLLATTVATFPRNKKVRVCLDFRLQLPRGDSLVSSERVKFQCGPASDLADSPAVLAKERIPPKAFAGVVRDFELAPHFQLPWLVP